MVTLGLIHFALLGILIGTLQQPAQKPPSFAIYLMDYPKGSEVPGSIYYGPRDASKIALESTPVISDADILSYDLRQHSMRLTNEALARIPRAPSLHGFPFVVIAKGERIYLGVFTRGISSIGFSGPAIVVDRKMLHEDQPEDTLVIERGYPSAHFSGPDPRSDHRIIEALTELHKLKAADEWLVWHTDGAGDEATSFSSQPLKKQSAVLDNYLENNLSIHPGLKWEMEQGTQKKLDPRISLVGRWHGFDVYDVIEESYRLKQIILESPPGTFRILYSLDGTAAHVVPGPSKIIAVQGVPILVTSSPPDKTWYYFAEKLFLFDDQSGLPTELDVEGVIGTVIWEILPDRLRPTKAVNPFNLQTLTYQSPLYKDGDLKCCPTGGSMEIRLSLRGNALGPIYKKYDPTRMAR